MDPKACLAHLLEAVAARDFGEASMRLIELQTWSNMRGFMPGAAISAAVDALRQEREESR